MALNYFASLTQTEIDSSPVCTYIQDVQQDLQTQLINLDYEFQVDPAKDQLVADGYTTTYTSNNPNLVSLGTHNDIQNDGDQIINIGSQNLNKNSSNSTLIGHHIIVSSNTSLNMNNYNTVIGNGSEINLAGGGVEYNTLIASNQSLTGNNNIVIANDSALTTSNVSNTVQLLQAPINTGFGANPVANGSVIISSSFGGSTPSALPRVQYLSEHLTRLQGTNSSTQFNPAVTFALPPINGFMRIKYQGYNLLVPVIVDPDDSTEAPAYP